MSKVLVSLVSLVFLVLFDVIFLKKLKKKCNPALGHNIEESNQIIEERNHSLLYGLGFNMAVVGLLLLWWNVGIAALVLAVSVILVTMF